MSETTVYRVHASIGSTTTTIFVSNGIKVVSTEHLNVGSSDESQWVNKFVSSNTFAELQQNNNKKMLFLFNSIGYAMTDVFFSTVHEMAKKTDGYIFLPLKDIIEDMCMKFMDDNDCEKTHPLKTLLCINNLAKEDNMNGWVLFYRIRGSKQMGYSPVNMFWRKGIRDLLTVKNTDVIVDVGGKSVSYECVNYDNKIKLASNKHVTNPFEFYRKLAKQISDDPSINTQCRFLFFQTGKLRDTLSAEDISSIREIVLTHLPKSRVWILPQYVERDCEVLHFSRRNNIIYIPSDHTVVFTNYIISEFLI